MASVPNDQFELNPAQLKELMEVLELDEERVRDDVGESISYSFIRVYTLRREWSILEIFIEHYRERFPEGGVTQEKFLAVCNDTVPLEGPKKLNIAKHLFDLIDRDRSGNLFLCSNVYKKKREIFKKWTRIFKLNKLSNRNISQTIREECAVHKKFTRKRLTKISS